MTVLDNKTNSSNTTNFLIFLLLFEFSVYIANDLIMPGMIEVVKDFAVSDLYIASSLSVFILGGASLQLFLGPLSDKYGKRKIMLFGVLVFLLSSLANSLSTSINQFMISRFFQGMGICYVGVIGYATIQEMFKEKKAVKIISIMTSISILAPLLGPLIGSMFLEHFHWRWLNAIIVSLGSIALIGLYFFFPNKTNSMVIESTPKKNKENLFIESVKNYKSILKNKKFMLGVFAFGCVEIPLVLWIALSPIVLIRKADLTQFEYGVYQIPVFGMFILGVAVLQLMLKSSSLEKIIIKGSVIVGLGLILSFMLPTLLNQHHLATVIPYALYALGLGMISSPISRLVLFSSSVSKGSVAGIFSLITMIMFGVGTELAGILYRTQNNIILGGIGLTLFVLYVFTIKHLIKSDVQSKTVKQAA